MLTYTIQHQLLLCYLQGRPNTVLENDTCRVILMCKEINTIWHDAISYYVSRSYGNILSRGCIDDIILTAVECDMYYVVVFLATYVHNFTLQIFDRQDDACGTVFMFACEEYNVRMVHFLLRHRDSDAFINMPNEYGYTPLMVACSGSSVDIVDILLRDDRVNINAHDRYGETALYFAAQNGQVEIVQRLLNHPHIDVNIQNREGETALMCAMQYQWIDHILVSKILMKDTRTNLTLRNKIGESLWDIARGNYSTRFIYFLDYAYPQFAMK